MEDTDMKIIKFDVTQLSDTSRWNYIYAYIYNSILILQIISYLSFGGDWWLFTLKKSLPLSPKIILKYFCVDIHPEKKMF